MEQAWPLGRRPPPRAPAQTHAGGHRILRERSRPSRLRISRQSKPMHARIGPPYRPQRRKANERLFTDPALCPSVSSVDKNPRSCRSDDHASIRIVALAVGPNLRVVFERGMNEAAFMRRKRVQLALLLPLLHLRRII